MGAGASGLGIGIDLLEVDRFERALARRPRLAERLFSEHERAYSEARPRPARHLAARFCAKEAVAKALGERVWSFSDVEVVSGGGPPRVSLHGRLAERARELDVAPVISLTHTRTTAAASALLRRARGDHRH
ncbi:MAG TPA: holo-ACP synthase [Thermoleophilaceae bacterium]|nr:holo-ACP synthase [Thermoleophilaceae bacterium]